MSTRSRSHPTPVLRDTLYDRVTSWTIALFVGMVAMCVCVVAVWITNRLPPPPQTVPVELVEVPGGIDDGAPDETLRVDSPEPEVHDASPTEMPSDKSEIAEALESVVELSESATQQIQQQFDTGIQNSGKPGSARGTGKKGLGVGPGAGGVPREQRWFVRYGERAGVDEYARQLEFFGIELGALLPAGKLAYLSSLTADRPAVRYADGGQGEQRMYMTWQGGDRRGADVELFKRANVEVHADTAIFHFYPKATESQLARLELDYRKRPLSQIRRTYFSVEPAGKGYQFSVVRQIYFQ
ncbi:MAG: hypothetical protein JSS49_01895 [Planctomycetes bacterium]|nr:hypothetical protein [Planctomycetota bacterium]